MNAVESRPKDLVLQFVCDNGANPNEMRGSYNIALWLEGAPVEVKNKFIDLASGLYGDCGLRVCSTCGKFMTEGYYLAGDYACSEECAIRNYMSDGKTTELEACELFEQELLIDEETCAGEVYWTEW